MLFKNRIDAGISLSKVLKKYQDAEDTMILGLPRGGVVVAAEVAKELHLPLDIIVPRKLGAPNNAELAIGAVALNEVILDQEIIIALEVTPSYIDKCITKEKKEAERRTRLFRKNKPPLEFINKTCIVVDDGIATGSTMRASIAALKKSGASKIVVAVPVGPLDTIENLKQEVDEIICLYTPTSFMAVGQFYENFPQTTDEEVLKILWK